MCLAVYFLRFFVIFYIRSTITVFPPRTDGQHDYRIWNATLIKYAGYEQEDGTIIGDPGSVDFTKVSSDHGIGIGIALL